MILVIDNFDSFTYNLVDYFEQLSQEVEVKRNNLPLNHLLSDEYSGVVLSPGPGIPTNAGHLMEVISYYSGKIPLLGICLGHQAIGMHYKTDLVHAQKPMHGKISEIIRESDPIFSNIPKRFNVVRYHSLICHNLTSQLKIISTDNAGEIMAMRHQYFNIYGLQFHPEAILTEYGLDILRNWINLIDVSD